MDTSNSVVFVNGELLPIYIGKRVKALIQVIQSDSEFTTGKSTDERQLVIRGLPHVSPMNYVEVIDVAESNASIHAELWTNFGNNAGMLYKTARVLVMMLHGLCLK